MQEMFSPPTCRSPTAARRRLQSGWMKFRSGLAWRRGATLARRGSEGGLAGAGMMCPEIGPSGPSSGGELESPAPAIPSPARQQPRTTAAAICPKPFADETPQDKIWFGTKPKKGILGKKNSKAPPPRPPRGHGVGWVTLVLGDGPPRVPQRGGRGLPACLTHLTPRAGGPAWTPSPSPLPPRWPRPRPRRAGSRGAPRVRRRRSGRRTRSSGFCRGPLSGGSLPPKTQSRPRKPPRTGGGTCSGARRGRPGPRPRWR